MGKSSGSVWLGVSAAALALLLVACGGQTPPAENAEAPTSGDDTSSDTDQVDDESSAASATGDKPCRADSFEFPEVEAACNEGGVKAAKSLMKDLVKKGKAAGQSLKCSSCHDNTKDYTLADNAVSDLRALMEL